jgi:class 3 adenylate cyclase/tetratricopeptide (TPR) repeat protein
VRCPRCGEENAERARFCSSCGAPLEAPASGREERKVVSILFVDLVGFTARSDRADPEDVRSTLRVYHDLLKREIERFGGTVEKFIGDAVMAVFGAPVAHEDDAERAVRASLRIIESIAKLNEERPDLDLAVRGAVNTGEALVTLGARPERGEGFVTGDVVNIASRLQAVAPAGGVVVGEPTYRTTRLPIEYEELEPVAVKGKGDPIRIWRVVAARSRFGVDVEQGTRAPLIGREYELSLLQDLYRRAVREQSPQLVTLSGEPGVGKTRLTWEFQGFIDDEPDLVYWRQGRCLPYGEGITFWALGEIVKSHAGIVENDGPGQAADKLEKAVQTVVEQEGERDWIRARLAPLVGLGTEAISAEREESFAAWRSFLEATAASRPLVMVIEDLHWADPAMLAFVEYLAEWASGVPLLVLCTARPELFDREPGWGGGKRNHTAVSLSPLSPDETARLIAALLDQAVLPAETQAALLGRASGNPLYAEEFIRMLIDRDILARRGSTWELVAGDEEIPVPESVHALIAARLDTLPPERKSLLQDAAVIGKVFWAGALVEMGGLDPRAVREGLHELARKELLRPARRPSIEGETEYAFWHLLIRDVAYGQIPRAARAVKHRAAAEWIERIAGERVADSAELLAYHYEQALRLWRAASGGDDAELESRARRFLMLAGERGERLDTTKAVASYERALELTPPGHPDRVLILLRVARSLWGTGGFAKAEAWCLEALETARADNDTLSEGDALTWLSKLAWARGDTARQFDLLEDAVRILEALPPGPELASAYSRLTAAYGLAWRPAETMRAAERGLNVVREYGSEADLMSLLQFRGQARADFGEVEEGFEDLREGLRLALEAAPAALVAAAHVNLGDMTWTHHGPAKGQELYEAAAELAERRGAPGAADWARMESMWTRYDLGDWDELLAIGQRILDRVLGPGTSQIWVLTEAYRRDVLLHRGVADPEGVVEGKILPRAREIGDGQVLVPTFRVAALGRMARGDVAGAVDLVRELHELLRDRPGPRSWMLNGAARVCLAADEAGLLRSLIDQGVEYLTRDQNSMASARAMLAEVEGDRERASAGYQDAADRWEAFPAVLEHGLALMGAARCLLALGRESQGTERLRAARERFGALKAAPLVAEVDDLLAHATSKTS